MIRYLLDSDHISFFLRGDAVTQNRLREEIKVTGISIISVQEVFNGWVSLLNRSDNEINRIRSYENFYAAMMFFKSMPVLNYDNSASQIYRQLIQDNSELGKRRLEKDIRIASIALSLDATIATIVTRNYRDFSLVPGLKIVDWSV